MKIICYADDSQQRSKHIARAMCDGFARHGLNVSIAHGFDTVAADMAVAYGWTNRPTFEAYRTAGARFLYIDLGYWHRKPPGRRLDGYHKVVVDDWSPLPSLMRGCPADRFNAFGIDVLPSRLGDEGHVVVAGMSAKSAADHGFDSEQWETAAIERLAARTARSIIYRPKPSWKGAQQLPGSQYSIGTPIETVLRGAFALVTHHSNAAIDALAAGVPVYCEAGAASLLSTVNMDAIDTASVPSEEARRSLLQDIAWTQWTPDEMRSGEFWAHYESRVR